MKRSPLFLSLFLLYLIPNIGHSKGRMYMAKAHLFPKIHKIHLGTLNADEKRCFEYALKQWIMYDKAPTATVRGRDKNNDNPNRTNRHVMAAGPCHNTGNAHIKVGTGKNRETKHVGRSSRSFSRTEQAMMKARYGAMSPFHKKGKPVKDPTTPEGRAEWFTSDPAKAHMKVVEKDKIPGHSSSCLGKADYDVIWNSAKTKGWKSVQNPSAGHRTPELCVRKMPKGGKTYCYPSDTNGDGWITNADTPCPPNTIDYYQLLKHELGHFFSFLHQGKDFTEHEDGEPEHCCPGGVNEMNSPANEGGCSHGKDGEDDEHEGRMYFHSDRPGGQGGFDIWYCVWDDDLNQWGAPQNCGGAINTPYDEVDPHSAFGDAMLYYASNQPGGQGGFDLYYAVRMDTTTWDSVGTLQGLNSPANEFDPHEFGELFFLTSNRPGGQGNNDIWVANLQDTFNFLWNPPQNLGPNINTIANEEDPYVGDLYGPDIFTIDTGVLYFASDRPDTAGAPAASSAGFGGYDIHYALLTGGVWGSAVNIGPPVNTADNEKGPEWDTRGNLLYYESDIGIGMGGADILASPNVKPRPSVTWLYDGRGDPGDTVTVGYIVKNEGMIPLDIMPVVTTDNSWAYSADPSSFFLNPGEEMEYEVEVEIPDTNSLGEAMLVILTAVAGPVSKADTAQAWSGGPTSVDPRGAPFQYELRQNYPNPFNPVTTIDYVLAEPTFEKLRIYDVAGRLVRTLVDRAVSQPGEKRALWDGRDNVGNEVASGIYFYRLETRGFVQTRKMVLLR